VIFVVVVVVLIKSILENPLGRVLGYPYSLMIEKSVLNKVPQQ